MIMTIESPEFWRDCSLVEINEQIKHGLPVFKGTRLEPETVIGSVDAYTELQGLSEDAAIEAAYKDHPTAPGIDGIRQVLAYFDSHKLQLQLQP